jgi:hypothetical protein
MVERYTYVDLDSQQLSIDETGLITFEKHIGGRGPIPMKYSIGTSNWTAHFVRDPNDVFGGLAITVLSSSNEQLALQITERSLNVPHYGPCLDYFYSSREFKQINFMDKCPDSIPRDFHIAFEIFLNDDVAQKLRVRY